MSSVMGGRIGRAAPIIVLAFLLLLVAPVASANTLRLSIYDETTGDRVYGTLIKADVWELGGSSSQTVTVDTAYKAITITGYENIMVRIYTQDDSYYPRTYFLGSPAGDISLDAFTPSSSASVVSTTIRANYPSSWERDAITITVKGIVDGSYSSGTTVTITSGKLDANNELGCFLLLGKSYTVEATYEGTTYSYTYTPVSSGVFYLSILSGITPTTYMTSHSVRYWYTQEIDGNRSMTFSYNDSAALTDSITARFYANGTEEVYNTTVNSSSAVITYNVSANNTTSILLEWESSRDGTTLSGSHWFTHEDVSGLSVFDSDLRMGIALGFIILTTLIATAVSGGIGVLVAFSTIVLFSWLGWLPVGDLLLWLMGMVVLFSVAAYRRAVQ